MYSYKKVLSEREAFGVEYQQKHLEGNTFCGPHFSLKFPTKLFEHDTPESNFQSFRNQQPN